MEQNFLGTWYNNSHPTDLDWRQWLLDFDNKLKTLTRVFVLKLLSDVKVKIDRNVSTLYLLNS